MKIRPTNNGPANQLRYTFGLGKLDSNPYDSIVCMIHKYKIGEWERYWLTNTSITYSFWSAKVSNKNQY